MLINIPFAGFYESKWSNIVDSACNSLSENEKERQESSQWYPETFQPEELRVDVSEFAWDCVDYGAAYLEIAQDYVAGFSDQLNQWAKEIDQKAPECALVFSRLDSPREYNFRTDDIDCEMSESFVLWMFAQSEKDSHAELIKTLERRHKSRSGFTSFYSWRLSEWLAKPVTEWDYHELRSLLESVFPVLASDSEWEWDIYYPMGENDYQYFDSHFDFAKYETKVKESRAELLLAWIQTDSENAVLWVSNHHAEFAALSEVESDLAIWGENMRESLPYHCDKTPDLFEG